ncbi:hypothetical protein OSTOST_20897, partial [Ostertagia ostertagi]
GPNTNIMPRRRRTEEQIKHLEPTVNRFAEDTSMLGFRYLHTRYKTWFRNPLTTQRSYESPQHMQFPSIGICNKMQVRASALAMQEPELVRLLSLIYDDDGNSLKNESLLDSMRMFDEADVLAIQKAAHQKVDDLFLR